jgi:hypothetical protein
MKNIYWILGLAFMLSVTSCSNDEIVKPALKTSGLIFNLHDFQMDASSRTNVEVTEQAALFTWAENDTIGIFPEVDASQARFLMKNGAGTKSATFDGGGWALKTDVKYASYYPYIPDINLDKTHIPVDYTGFLQVGSANTNHLGAYDFMAACSNVPENGNVVFDFNHLGCLLQLKLTLPEPGEYTSVTLTYPQKVFVSGGYYDLMADDIAIQPETLSDSFVIGLDSVKTSNKNEEVIVYALIAPVDLSKDKVEVLVRGRGDIEANASVQMKNMLPGVAYSVSAVLETENQGPAPDGGEEGGDDDGDDDVDLDGVVSVEKAGTLEKLLGETKFQRTELKIKGKLNSDDVALIRRMSGGYRDTTDVDFGVLKSLDLSQATFVAGGLYYLDNGRTKYRIKSSDEVGDCMFNGCGNLETLILPFNVTRIGEASVSSCLNLKEIDIPDGVVSFGMAAFNSCKSLIAVQLPSALVSMGSDVFHSCSSLQRIVIPVGVTEILANSFGHCTSLSEIVLPEGLISIGNAAFAACDKLERIVIPNTVTEIGERAFGSCATLSDVTLSSGQSILGSYTFENCAALTSIVIPEGVEVIASRAFYGCVNLTHYQLPSTLVELESKAFYTATFKSPIVVECAAVEPPIIGEDAWKRGEHVVASKLYVKDTSVKGYQSSNWNEYFGEILAQ